VPEKEKTKTFKRFLPLAGALAFVENVAEGCFDAETGEYLPQAKEFAVRCEVLTRYGGLKLPEDMEARYAFAFHSFAAKRVLWRVDRKQIKALRAAADEKIRFKLALFASAASLKTAELLQSFEALSSAFETLFAGLSAADVSAFAKAVGAIKRLDEQKLVQAVLKAQNP
jgi:hypothetical protein